ncbi:MAG: hypothetical protein H0T73_18840, partial [Ardenticatenales bacterium]|nr:hypothetical protein [Ardenticatenales bacterium]
MQRASSTVVRCLILGMMLLLAACQSEEPRVEPPTVATETIAVAETTLTDPAPEATATRAATETAPPATPTSAPQELAENMTLVGSLPLEPAGRGAHADVAAYEDLAIVGSRCTGAGVHIIDISDPTDPEKLANTPESPNTSMEDMQVLRIGEQDVLVIGFQNCANPDDEDQGLEGIELVDITTPARPRHLSLFATSGGVHELDLAETPDGRALALLAIPQEHEEGDGEESHSQAEEGGQAGLVIVDISDPRKPTLASQWDILDEPTLGEAVQENSAQGSFPIAYLHSVRANEDGTLAYLSYWDAGVILLDISAPESPRYLSRTTFTEEDEGNAHSVTEAADGQVMVQAQEDFSPYRLHVSSSALDAQVPLIELGLGTEIKEFPDATLAGEAVHGGRGCFEDEPLVDADGKIVLVAQGGGCAMSEKIAVAQEAGAIAVILYEEEDGEETVEEEGPPRDGVTLPDGTRVTLEIPVLLSLSAGSKRLLEAAPLELTIESRFDGFGDLRFYDISDSNNPRLLGSFASPNTRDEAVAELGVWSAHNPEVVGDTLYASWYSE